jgi:hypothetical protein
MIPNTILFVFSLPLYLLQYVGGILNFALPPWLTDEIATIMGGTGILNTIFPIYPHPGMAGLAGSIGIMTLFGFAVTLMGYLLVLSLAYKLIKILLNLFSIGNGPSIGTGGR